MKTAGVVAGLISVCLLTSVCFAGTAKAGEAKKMKYPVETKKLLEKIKGSRSNELGQLICSYANEEPSEEELGALYNLMDNKEVILEDDQEYAAAKIQVRDIAFVCLQELTGNILKNGYKTKGTITYQSEDGTNYVFAIPSLSDNEYRTIKSNTRYWAGNYKKRME